MQVHAGTPHETLKELTARAAVDLSPQFRREVELTQDELDDIYQTLQHGVVPARGIAKLDNAVREIERILSPARAELGDRFVEVDIIPRFVSRGLRLVQGQLNGDHANGPTSNANENALSLA